MFKLLVLSLIVVGAFADIRSQRMNFEAFKKNYGKNYQSKEEEEMRFANYRASVARVMEKNAEHVAQGGEAVFGITKYADLSVQEFKNTLLKFTPFAQVEREMAIDGFNAPLPEIDSSFGNTCTNTTCDWRTMGAVSPVKDQGQCGSCWAFSATEEIESMTYLKRKVLPVLAPQQIVSCDQVDQGCNGGDTPTAYKYVMQAGGLDTEQSYPYRSGDGNDYSCHFNKAAVAAKISGFTYACPPCQDTCDHQDENLLASNMAKTGPVSVCLNAEPWQDYMGGILKSGCSHAASDMDHCVQLVGYNKAGSTPYWILRNSWNTDWGIEGYIYVAMKDNLCGVANEATFVTAL